MDYESKISLLQEDLEASSGAELQLERARMQKKHHEEIASLKEAARVVLPVEHTDIQRRSQRGL